MMARQLHLLLLLAIIFPVIAYNTDICCELAKEDQAFVEGPDGGVPPSALQTCGQAFVPNTTAALPLYVDYAFCSKRCGGMGRSNISQPSQWAAPVVQFLLPSVIFSLSIPREKIIDTDYAEMFISRRRITNRALQSSIVFLGFIFAWIPVLVDGVLWIMIIVVGAGNMIIGGLYEAVIDFRILKFVKALDDIPALDDSSALAMKRELLATLACGNLRLSKNHHSKTKILESIQLPEPEGEKSRSRLLNLIGAQSGFGGAIGSPVLFYLGAFIYTILDLQNDPSDQDSAISLGFGIEWMIIVHVAIISGTLLAANNPSTSSGITGTKHDAMDRHRVLQPEKWYDWLRLSKKTYETEFQPVSIWDRGQNKWEWIESTEAWTDKATKTQFQKDMRFGVCSWIWIFVMAFFLIVIPPAAGGVVAYATPPKGVACRSLSFILYGCGQLITTILAIIRAAHPKKPWLKRWMRGWRFIVLSALPWFTSLLAAIGGTVMQISGVYRNCVCYALAPNWYNLTGLNPPIPVANDTEAARSASGWWIWAGALATVFMGVNCYVGWWYQIFVRRSFTERVEGMWVPAIVVQNPTAAQPQQPSRGTTAAAQPQPQLGGNSTSLQQRQPRNAGPTLGTDRRPSWIPDWAPSGIKRSESIPLGTLNEARTSGEGARLMAPDGEGSDIGSRSSGDLTGAHGGI